MMTPVEQSKTNLARWARQQEKVLAEAEVTIWDANIALNCRKLRDDIREFRNSLDVDTLVQKQDNSENAIAAIVISILVITMIGVLIFLVVTTK